MASDTSANRSEQPVEVKFAGSEAVEIYRRQIAQAAQLDSQSEALKALGERLEGTVLALKGVADRVQAIALAQEAMLAEQKVLAATQQASLARLEEMVARTQRDLQALAALQTRPFASSAAGDFSSTGDTAAINPLGEQSAHGHGAGPAHAPTNSDEPRTLIPGPWRRSAAVLLAGAIVVVGLVLTLRTGWASLLQ